MNRRPLTARRGDLTWADDDTAKAAAEVRRRKLARLQRARRVRKKDQPS